MIVDMLFTGMIEWWYINGWKMFLHGLANNLKNAADFFSIRLLVRNMFAPFRQISAEGTDSSAMDARMAAFFDRLLSRVIGAIVRFFLLIIGTVLIIMEAVVGIVLAIAWPLAPLLIVLCVLLSIMQVSF